MLRRISVGVIVVLALSAGVRADEQLVPRSLPVQRGATSPRPPGRVFLEVNGALQSNSATFADTRRDPFFGETASWTADYSVKNGPAVDASVGVRVWGPLVVRGGYTRFTDTRVAAIAGAVPHPFFFNQDRSYSGEAPGLKQVEQAVHVSASWIVPLHGRIGLEIYGGPSMFRVERDLVEDVRYSETYPYDSASFEKAIVKDVRDDRIGYHAGADVTYFFTRVLGIGGGVRFARARMQLTSPATGGPVAFNAGGLQTAVGIRLRFGSGPRRASRARSDEPPRRPVSPTPASEPDTAAPVPGQVAPPRSDAARLYASVTTSAPVFVLPDAARQPLAVLKPGTRIKVLEERGEWLHIEFHDQRWGARIGWLLRQNSDW